MSVAGLLIGKDFEALNLRPCGSISGTRNARRLAHVPRSQVVQAYQRSDLLERRAEVLQAWSNYISSPSAAVHAELG